MKDMGERKGETLLPLKGTEHAPTGVIQASLMRITRLPFSGVSS